MKQRWRIVRALGLVAIVLLMMAFIVGICIGKPILNLILSAIFIINLCVIIVSNVKLEYHKLILIDVAALFFFIINLVYCLVKLAINI